MDYMTTSSTADIRTWAKSAGLAVGDRGRLSPDIVAAYNDAHSTAAASAASIAAARQEQPDTTTSAGRTVRAKQHWDWARRENTATASS
jgi:hypothetical protein